VRTSGYPLIFTQRMDIETMSHMCGTAVTGPDPATSVPDTACRSHNVDNLWLGDSSLFPSSGPQPRLDDRGQCPADRTAA